VNEQVTAAGEHPGIVAGQPLLPGGAHRRGKAGPSQSRNPAGPAVRTARGVHEASFSASPGSDLVQDPLPLSLKVLAAQQTLVPQRLQAGDAVGLISPASCAE
jgi:hypothetical protein